MLKTGSTTPISIKAEGEGYHDDDYDRLEGQRLDSLLLVGATLRGYTVVVPVDTTAASTDYEQVIGFYNILNQNSSNLTNQPLKPKASTLSRTDMITFQ